MLTPKQQRFVEEYLVDLNASAAARRAGYSVKTAGWIGQQLLAKTHIAQAVAAGRAELSARTGRTAADVLADIERVKTDAMQQVVDTVTGASAMLDHKAALKALELEGKHRGCFDDRLRVMGPDGGPVQQITRIELVARKA